MPDELPGYVSEAPAQLQGKLGPGCVHIVVVAHDDECNIWAGRTCTCEPVISVRSADEA